MVRAQDPLHLVRVVRTHIGVHALTRIEETGPVVDAARHKGPPLHGPEPHIVIPAFRNRSRLLMGYRSRRPDLRLDGMHAPDLALQHHLAGESVRRCGAALRASLIDGAETAAGLHEPASLAKGEADRLFAIDVLAGMCREHGGYRVPAVASRDEHGIYVLTGQQLAKVGKGPTLFRAIVRVDQFLSRRKAVSAGV